PLLVRLGLADAPPKAEAKPVLVAAVPAPKLEPKPKPAAPDGWATGARAGGPTVPPEVKVLTVARVVVPDKVPDCILQDTVIAPNGQP
ncbi:hypothetical protein, partial [Aeromonas hydrophila]|uniref:hypothetical protein n=1 Tax=Aeromonas hydrophila TaxID=644 RepID=UPI001933AFB6